MRRRLEIARGMVHDPQILFLDEPTTGLDPVSRISVWEMITHLRAQQGRTLFLTTHYMDEADRLCDRVAIVDKGRIVALDTPVALKSSVPGASRIELQFEPDLPNGAADLEKLAGGQIGARARFGHLSRFERSRPGIGAGIDRTGARSQARIEELSTCNPPVWTTYFCITPAMDWRRCPMRPLPPAGGRRGGH